jgi:hypothetical protein
MIRGITFAEQVFYSADFAHYMNFFLNGDSGITNGCGITEDGTKVTIDTGYFVAHGRMLNVETAEVVEASRGFAVGYNRIVYEIDLSKENTVTAFRQGAIRVLNTEELVQENLDAGGKVYQFPFCHFQWSGAAITNFVIDAPALDTTRVTTFTARVGTAWTNNGGYYTQEVEVMGIKESDKPIMDLVADPSNFEAEQEAYGNVFKVTTATNKITVYSAEPTTTAFYIQLKVVK